MSELVQRQADSWADILPAVGDLSNKISNTNFVPKGLRGKPAEIAACILTGREIGVGPMQALAKIHVIDGRPSMSAELMRSLVMAAGHEISYPTYTDDKVTAVGRRGDSAKTTEVTWTLKDAQRIGVATKDTWKKYPRQMLAARATSELCRLLFPDALGGISYTNDEAEELSAEETKTTVSRSKGRKAPEVPEVPETPINPPTAITGPPSPIEAEAEPEVDTETGEIVDAEVIEEAEPILVAQPMNQDAISAAQVKMMGGLMSALGMKREAALEFCISAIGRPIESRNDLTKTEASEIIESLVALKELQGGEDD